MSGLRRQVCHHFTRKQDRIAARVPEAVSCEMRGIVVWSWSGEDPVFAEKASVGAPEAHEFGVGTGLHHIVRVEHHDPVRPADGAQPVRDRAHRAGFVRSARGPARSGPRSWSPRSWSPRRVPSGRPRPPVRRRRAGLGRWRDLRRRARPQSRSPSAGSGGTRPPGPRAPRALPPPDRSVRGWRDDDPALIRARGFMEEEE